MSREENIGVGSYVHVCNRGAKKMPIYRQESDLWRLRAGLFYFNSAHLPGNWTRDIVNFADVSWPTSWGNREPLVTVLGFALMRNHFHLILKEIREGGISSFMHKFTMGYSKFINAKYNESGSLFQGKFRARIVNDDSYLRHLAVYVLVKNPFETYPLGGFYGAMGNFNSAFSWAVEDPFFSLGEYIGRRSSPIIEKDMFSDLFVGPREFEEFSKEYIRESPIEMLM